MVNDFIKKIVIYQNLVIESKTYAEKIGLTIVNNLKDVIPNLEYSVGFAGRGIEVICFKGGLKGLINSNAVSLISIIKEVIPELDGYIDDPFGCYVSNDKIDIIKERLLKMKCEKSKMVNERREK